MPFDEHQEHGHEWLICRECGEKYCRNCSDAGLPKTFCSQVCQDTFYNDLKAGVA